jgi:hypothetical protein
MSKQLRAAMDSKGSTIQNLIKMMSDGDDDKKGSLMSMETMLLPREVKRIDEVQSREQHAIVGLLCPMSRIPKLGGKGDDTASSKRQCGRVPLQLPNCMCACDPFDLV